MYNLFELFISPMNNFERNISKIVFLPVLINKLLKYLAFYKCYEVLMLRFNTPNFHLA